MPAVDALSGDIPRKPRWPRWVKAIRRSSHAIEPRKARGAAAAAPKRKVAVLVAHGMGQQSPYHTLGQVVEGLHAAERVNNPLAPPRPVVQMATIPVGDKTVARAEMDLGQGAERTRVHVYEAYWAPLTEGNVNLKDVSTFIGRGAAKGFRVTVWDRLVNGWRWIRGDDERRWFKRWMFGRNVFFDLGNWTTFYLCLALMVVSALVAMNIVATNLALKVVTMNEWEPPMWMGGGFHDLTLLMAAFAVSALLLGFSVWRGTAGKARARRKAEEELNRGFTEERANALRGVVAPLRWVVLSWSFLVVALVLALAFIVTIAIWGALLAAAALLGNPPPAGPMLHLPRIPVWGVFVVWGAVLYVSVEVSNFLVQYIGDVAAYVSQHKLDRFKDLRDNVRKCVLDVAKTVYARRANNGFEYGEVYIVGHSLGSVVAYDTLNALILDDIRRRPEKQRKVIRRTRLLLTFGSPLDKTAFFFGLHGSGETEQAAGAAHQPLVRHYRYRRFRWINRHARPDIISGALDFYDLPVNHIWRVRNKPHGHSRLPLAAHVEYWDDVALWDDLRKAIFRGPPVRKRRFRARLRRLPGGLLQSRRPRSRAS